MSDYLEPFIYKRSEDEEWELSGGITIVDPDYSLESGRGSPFPSLF